MDIQIRTHKDLFQSFWEEIENDKYISVDELLKYFEKFNHPDVLYLKWMKLKEKLEG